MKIDDAPCLTAALAANPIAQARLRRERRRRFLAGDFPEAFDWLLEFPDLVLAAHADALARQTRREAVNKKPTRRADRVGTTNA
jgi:hypothetical protein